MGCLPMDLESVKLGCSQLYRNAERIKVTQSDSKVAPADRPQSDLKVTPDHIFESLLSHFGVGLPESLLGHSISFCISVELGARPLHGVFQIPHLGDRHKPFQRDEECLKTLLTSEANL